MLLPIVQRIRCLTRWDFLLKVEDFLPCPKDTLKVTRNVKDMASKAKDDIVESAGIKDLDLKNLSNLDPSKLANNVFDDKEETKPQAQKKFDQDAT